MSVAGTTFHHRLHALDLTTGGEVMPATDIQATSGAVSFAPKQYEERSGLLLLNNVIYLTWTSHCDASPYNGWVMGYGESSLQQLSVINVTPGGRGGIWMSGDGLAADSSGNIYFLDGNGVSIARQTPPRQTATTATLSSNSRRPITLSRWRTISRCSTRSTNR